MSEITNKTGDALARLAELKDADSKISAATQPLEFQTSVNKKVGQIAGKVAG